MLGVLQYKQDSPMELYCDSKSTIELSKNLILHRHSKYININYHFIREFVHGKDIEIDYCRIKKQVTDIFTEAFKTNIFLEVEEDVGMFTFEELGLKEVM